MREITSHAINPANDRLKILVVDEPGQGGASALYHIAGFNSSTNPADPFVKRHGQPGKYMTVLFQNGPIDEGGAGVNGITHEALIAILIDRLEGFQAGKYKCKENAMALDYLYLAQGALFARTQDRMDRGVEGTHTV